MKASRENAVESFTKLDTKNRTHESPVYHIEMFAYFRAIQERANQLSKTLKKANTVHCVLVMQLDEISAKNI